MALSKTAAHHRARIASLSRDRDLSDPELLDARRQLRFIRLTEAVREALADSPVSPALTAAQRESIANVLRGETCSGAA